MAQPTAKDALRLVDAFHAIEDETEWMKVIELAEMLAKYAQPKPETIPATKSTTH